MSQSDGDLCRYHAFMERGWPFTREFGAGGVDGVALLTEYGIIVSIAVLLYLALGITRDLRRSRPSIPGEWV